MTDTRATTRQIIDRMAPHWDERMACIAALITHWSSVSAQPKWLKASRPSGLLTPITAGLNAVCAHMAGDHTAYPRDILRVVTDAFFEVAVSRYPPHPLGPCFTQIRSPSAAGIHPTNSNIRRWITILTMAQVLGEDSWRVDRDRMHRIRIGKEPPLTPDQAFDEALASLSTPPPSGL